MMMRRAAGTLIFALVCVALGVGITLVAATRISLPDSKPIPIISGELLYQQHCARCHGADGRGIQAYAPALNNPQYFGFDYMAAWNQPIQTAYTQFEYDLQQRENAFVILGNPAVTQAQKDAALITLEQSERSTVATSPDYVLRDIDLLIAEREQFLEQVTVELEYRDYLPDLHRFYKPGEANQEPDLSNYLIWTSRRLTQVHWENADIRTFTYFAIAAGRPDSNMLWESSRMPAFSKLAGGSLSDDDIWALTDYIMQWDKGDDWTLDDLLAVEQFARIPNPKPIVVESYPINFAEQFRLIYSKGDAAHGEALFNSLTRTEAMRKLGCVACHNEGVQAPSPETMWNSIVTERLLLPEFTGYDAEQYMVEAILMPNAYVVPPYAAIMPTSFQDQMSAQDLADIIAYLRSFADDE